MVLRAKEGWKKLETAEVANHFAGRACIGLLDIWVGYDERIIDEESRDLTTFQLLLVLTG
ncbi:hypothetical protein MPER_01500 [Moniliophthora perniciosa FA553]|nr:hypothetical protein MPER_01500 [Moniliophthora perniciosa FA553]